MDVLATTVRVALQEISELPQEPSSIMLAASLFRGMLDAFVEGAMTLFNSDKDEVPKISQTQFDTSQHASLTLQEASVRFDASFVVSNEADYHTNRLTLDAWGQSFFEDCFDLIKGYTNTNKTGPSILLASFDIDKTSATREFELASTRLRAQATFYLSSKPSTVTDTPSTAQAQINNVSTTMQNVSQPEPLASPPSVAEILRRPTSGDAVLAAIDRAWKAAAEKDLEAVRGFRTYLAAAGASSSGGGVSESKDTPVE